MALFTMIWQWIVWLFNTLLPFKEGRSLAPIVVWVIWIILDATMLVVLWFLNDWSGIGTAVQRMPFGNAGALRGVYLPILGQLIVFLGIVLYWFYLLWFAEPDESLYPDIDEAWREIMRALEHAGIQLPRVPLFLVVGRPGSAEEHLFEAAGLKLLVRQTPANPNAPVHVFADRDAVYVTCRGASVLGRLASILAHEDSASALSPEAEEELKKTAGPGSSQQDLLEMIRASAGQEATTLRQRVMRRLGLGRPLGTDFLSNPKEVAKFKGRLAHLCRLIVAGRQPFCPANGILLLVPLGGTDTPGEAQLTAQASQEDLSVVRQEMKLDCPLVTMLVDMEEVPGFTDFIQRLPAKDLVNRRGSGFPMATRLPRQEMMQQMAASLSWICTTYLQDSVYPLFEGETPTNMEISHLFPGNARLVLMLDEMNERAEALSMIIQQVSGPQHDSPFFYAGCYIAATGEKGSQGFVAGVFKKLLDGQSSVTWTQRARAEDAQCHTWANYYFILAVVLFLAWWGVLLAWFFLR